LALLESHSYAPYGEPFGATGTSQTEYCAFMLDTPQSGEIATVPKRSANATPLAAIRRF
jgi:hypothetical protein